MDPFHPFTQVLKEENEEWRKLSIVAKPCRAFSTAFHKVITNTNDGNVVHSPLSVHVLLSCLLNGANGITANEMIAALKLSDTKDLHEGYHFFIDKLNNIRRKPNYSTTILLPDPEPVVSLANALWVHKDVLLCENFKAICTDFYNCAVEQVNLEDKIQTAGIINSWVSEKTNGRIRNIIYTIRKDMMLVLVNAIYMKAKWKHVFCPGATRKKTFHVSQTLKKVVPTMFLTGDFYTGEIPSLRSRFITLPYEVGDLDMVIILPNEIEGLKFVEENFDWDAVANAKSWNEYTKLSLPKFTIEATMELTNVLCEMGMRSMFVARDWEVSATDSGRRLYVGSIVQKVYLNVDEEGTEAAATTYMMMFTGPAQTVVNEFYVDRPFVAVIRHVSSNIPLFISSIRDIRDI